MISRALFEIEYLGYISEFIKILGDSIDWFILSRFGNDPEKKRIYTRIYEEKSKKADVILNELNDLIC